MSHRILSPQLSRRNFLRTAGALGIAAASPLHNVLAQGRSVDSIGLQLYSLRKEMGEDFEGTLAKLAEIGFKEMEFAGYFNNSPAQVRGILDGLGLTSPAAHIQMAALRDNLQLEIDTAAALGQKYIIVPIVGADERGLDDYHRHAEFLNRTGEATKAAGIKMAYHNHNFEFAKQEGGAMGYDILLAETDASLVSMELDIFWIVTGGQDPIEYLRNHPGRFSMLHVKDRATDGKMVDVGRGTIDFAEVFAQEDVAGIEHFFIEHDNPDDGINSIAYSFNTVNTIRY